MEPDDLATVAVVDLRDPDAATRIDRACRTVGFVALTGHGIDPGRRESVLAAARPFFALPADRKASVALATGGPAWRGWFPLGDELTSGVPDLKEGFYVGREEPADGRPLRGPNRWPDEVPHLRAAVLGWMDEMEALGQRVLGLMALGLGLDADWFRRTLTADPTVLFRIFRYPPHPVADDPSGDRWGVAEHTDYGLITLLAHDGTPGLEVRLGDRWIPVPHDPDLIVCNLGDMLDRLTSGRYRSTPHRVRNLATTDRYSLPFFLDPSWDARIEPLDDTLFRRDGRPDGWSVPDDATARWDRADLRRIDGVYGDWLVSKVSRVFPDLAGSVLGDQTGGASR